MDSQNPDNSDDYEWHRSFIIFPRLGKMMSRDGVHTRPIWPGVYLVRKSRSLRSLIYRRPSS
jgi:hypothetical protein